MLFINSNIFILFGLSIASFRIYLEIIGFDFSKLPLTSSLAKQYSKDGLNTFHRIGLIFCVGYIVLFAPELLLN